MAKPKRVLMTVCLRTPRPEAIIAGGFKDARDTYMTDREWTGVWLADRPLGLMEGAKGEAVLMLQIPADVFNKYEWVEEGKHYREALIPARIVNRYASN
jgi:hypothetical protein